MYICVGQFFFLAAAGSRGPLEAMTVMLGSREEDDFNAVYAGSLMMMLLLFALHGFCVL